MVHFDGDPAFDASPGLAIGPLGSLALDIGMLLGSAAVLWLSSFAATRAVSLTSLLVIPTAASMAWHGTVDFESLWRGSAWMAGAFASIAILAGLTATPDRPSARRLLGATMAMVLAVGAALAVRGAWQFVVEHAETVAYFEQHGDEFLASRGWAPDSPQATSYERRLLGREATGWFGLANVYGGMMATITIALAGLLAARPLHASRGARVAGMAIGAAGLALVLLNGGKGAIGALALGAAVIVVGHWKSTGVRRGASCWRAGVTAIPLITLGVVAIRFALGPDALGGERSLLMRGFYLDGAMEAVRESPMGVGAGGFQPALLRLGAETCPEDAASVHHAWADWLVAAGAAGLSWVAMACIFAWWSTTPARRRNPMLGPEDGDAPPAAEGAFIWSIAAGAISLVATATATDPLSLLVQVGSVAGLAFAARAMAPWLAVSATEGASWRVAATCTLAAVASLDMMYWHTGATGWCWATMAILAASGLVSSGATSAPPLTRTAAWCPRLAALAAGGSALAALVWLPALFQQERALASTAAMISRAASAGNTGAGTEPLGSVRIRTSTYLGEAFTLASTRHRLREIAIEQALLGIPETQSREVADDAMMRAHQLASDARPDPNRTVAEARLFAETSAMMVARAGADPHGPATAWEEVVELSPRDARAWARLGDARARAGDTAAAAAAWTESLRRDALQWLDPVRQFSPRDRARIQRKLEEASIPEALRAPPASRP